MTYVLNKPLEKDKKLELCAPGGIHHICWDIREERQNCSCNGALKCGGYFEECQLDLQALQEWECKKAAIFELLRIGLVGEPEQLFTKYHEKDITCIRSHVYGCMEKRAIDSHDANLLYLYCSGDVMSYSKHSLLVMRSRLSKSELQTLRKTF